MVVLNMTEFKDEKNGGQQAPLVHQPDTSVTDKGARWKQSGGGRTASCCSMKMEKAHEQVHEIFFNIFDKGIIQDAEGRDIDFKNTIILMTTNAGSHEIMGLCQDPDNHSLGRSFCPIRV